MLLIPRPSIERARWKKFLDSHNFPVKDYKRILACLNKGLTPQNTSFMAKVSENLVYEYMNLISGNQFDIKEQKGIYWALDYDDISF